MGKKRHRKSYVSKGQRANVATNNLVKTSGIDSMLNKLNAWKAGKRGKITIANPNKQETNRPFIKVSFESYFGGTYKSIMARIKPSQDNDKVEIK